MGISIWRGKFNKTSGNAVRDLVAQRGRINIVVDLESVDFGHTKPDPRCGTLTLHGVTKPLALKINSFKCIYPLLACRCWPMARIHVRGALLPQARRRIQ